MDRKKQNYLITQLIKSVPLDKIDTRWADEPDALPIDESDALPTEAIRQAEAETEEYINKRRMLG